MPHARNHGQFGRPTYNQAQKVIDRFGGEAALADLLKISRITPYRWQYRRPYGSDGLIPTRQIDRIRQIARIEGIYLSPQDWLPERNTWEEEAPPVLTIPRPSLATLLE